ncbi:unnamed protein product [Paramecium pentaurelia]|uniref:Uncharacterized protein n=1 Tax=Paramecium pentaurelia TaxID=43138 RepID=A0A8S1WF19_9CILI|nr:unnamed protein product [Paramecium pentaurelia]
MNQFYSQSYQEKILNSRNISNYKLISSLPTLNTIIYYDFLIAFGINCNNTHLVAGANQKIIVYQLKDGIIKQINVLLNHLNYITTLNFFRQNQIFISGSRDSYFILWSLNQISNGKYFLKVKSHSAEINCVALPISGENFIITGSSDCTIKIWQSLNNSFSQLKCVQEIKEHSNEVFGLSINCYGNLFVSCSKDNFILVMEKSNTKNWILKQKIQILGFGYRICFLTDYIFAFQPRKPEPHNMLQIYQLSLNLNQFILIKECLVEGGDQSCNNHFQLLYNPNQQILFNKNGFYLNQIIFHKEEKQHNQFSLIQAINYETDTFYGTMSQDGQYLITWDTKSIQLQIRKNMNQK